MTTITITADMTVQNLIDAGISLARIQALVNAPAAPAASSSRSAFAEEVYQIVCANPGQNWKNGDVLKTWFPAGKCADAAMEKLRVKRHQEIGRALADLAADGRMVKDRSGDSASTTFYKVVESKMPAADIQADDASDAE